MKPSGEYAIVLANCRFLYGHDTEIITFRSNQGHQAAAIRFGWSNRASIKFLHSEKGASSTTQALRHLLEQSEIEIGKTFSNELDSPFSGDPAQALLSDTGNTKRLSRGVNKEPNGVDLESAATTNSNRAEVASKKIPPIGANEPGSRNGESHVQAVELPLIEESNSENQTWPKPRASKKPKKKGKGLNVKLNNKITPEIVVAENSLTYAIEQPVEETPIEEGPTNDAPVEEAPIEEAPIDEGPVEEGPVDQAPVDETPIEVPSVDGPVDAPVAGSYRVALESHDVVPDLDPETLPEEIAYPKSGKKAKVKGKRKVVKKGKGKKGISEVTINAEWDDTEVLKQTPPPTQPILDIQSIFPQSNPVDSASQGIGSPIQGSGDKSPVEEFKAETEPQISPQSSGGELIVLTISDNRESTDKSMDTTVILSLRDTSKSTIIDAVTSHLKSKSPATEGAHLPNVEIKHGVGKNGLLVDVSALEEESWSECLVYLKQSTGFPELQVNVWE
ncbi:hypothetical protein PVAG01_10104 [Phlyctema vagabunda]|uniref:Uncharacterized protein n=1 Tax=Phlyctema vagabunda TaxID=108571 RepID=A0ABR4P524_9HELO